MNTKRWSRPAIAAALAASVLLLGACSSGETKEAKGEEAKPAATSDSKAQTVTVTLKDNAFEPNAITVEQGTVTFEVKNTGAAIHNMHIISNTVEGKDFSSKPMIEGGQSDRYTATFTKSGTIKFQCDFHLPDMVGTITVK